jgi:hypothetical protein
MDLIVRKDVAIVHLGALDQSDQRVHEGGKLGVGMKRINP